MKQRTIYNSIVSKASSAYCDQIGLDYFDFISRLIPYNIFLLKNFKRSTFICT